MKSEKSLCTVIIQNTYIPLYTHNTTILVSTLEVSASIFESSVSTFESSVSILEAIVSSLLFSCRRQ